jgi:hypothetical protein
MNQAMQGGEPSAQAGGDAREQHPPTAAMNQATLGGARFAAGRAEPDPRRAHRGSTGGRCPAAGVREPVRVQAALNEARGLERSGKESECMDAIQRAKRFAG